MVGKEGETLKRGGRGVLRMDLRHRGRGRSWRGQSSWDIGFREVEIEGLA